MPAARRRPRPSSTATGCRPLAAAQLNATMCRALDFCDAMAPGPHIGAALFPAALAAAELAGGCSGEEFLTALVAGAELSSRFNLSEAQYDGFDPTGIVVVFSAAAAASRILGLTTEQTLHALALAFNRCGGSFQSHVDGSLGVRIVQGWVAQAGVQCAQMAQRGITGPDNFLNGHYGFAHLYGRGTPRSRVGDARPRRDVEGRERRLQEVPELRRHAGRDGACAGPGVGARPAPPRTSAAPKSACRRMRIGWSGTRSGSAPTLASMRSSTPATASPTRSCVRRRCSSTSRRRRCTTRSCAT